MSIARGNYVPMGLATCRLIDRDSDLRLELQPNGDLSCKEKDSDRSDSIQDWYLFEEWDLAFEERNGEQVPIELKFYASRDVNLLGAEHSRDSDGLVYMKDCQGRTVQAFQYKSLPPKTPNPTKTIDFCV